MRIEISHETVYRYAAPGNYSIQYLRLTPESGPGQTVKAWAIDAPARTNPWRDAFGNLVHVLVVDRLHGEVRIRALGRVETRDTSGVLPDDGGLIRPAVYRRQTALTRPDVALAEFAAGYRAALGRNPLDALHALMAGVREAVDYQPGETDATSTAAEAFAAGRGVCQDHAHVFLGAARALGLAARYVSGYLSAGGGDDEPYEASHAWAEVLVDDLGWVGFDCANRTSPTEAYVRVAVGLDYLDAAPIRGFRRGGGAEEMAVRVRVGAGQ